MFKKMIVILLTIVVLSTVISFYVVDNGLRKIKKQNPSNISNNMKSNKPNHINDGGKVDALKEKIDRMTLDEEIGQMVIAGIDGYEVDDNTKSLLKDYHVGGFILYGYNVKDAMQLTELLNNIKNENSSYDNIPLFLSVDEEGGRVNRMPPEIKNFPSNLIVGSRNDEKLSYNIGSTIGYELKSFGFNMDFAPVLDINSNPNNPVIGDRSFGQDADIVSRLGVKTMNGIESQGVISVVKHFPGHGDTSVDSHIGLPRVDYGLDRLSNFELVPFRNAIENGADAIMVAHILLPQIDPNYPSSLSNRIITGILRNQMGYDGVVMTDDITMGAIVKHYDLNNAVLDSINAGTDIILVGHGYDNALKVISSIKKAVNSGEIQKIRIDQSVYRILKLKQKYYINDKQNENVDVNKINNKVDNVLTMS